MDLEKLKKLTRLANNNPNDNEANLAARKVCKMLEEGNWALAPTVVASTVAPGFGGTWEGFDPFEDIIRRTAQEHAAEYARAEATRKAAEERIKQQKEQAERNAQAEQNRRAREERQNRNSFDPEEWFHDIPGRLWVNRRTGEKITEIDFNYRNARWRPRSPFSYGPVYDEAANWNFGSDAQKEFFTGRRQKRERPSRTLKCTACGKEQETKFQGPENQFKCWVCCYP